MQPSTNPAEQQETTLLVLLAQAGDRATLEQLLRESHAPLQHYIASLVGPDLADDILQETALQIFPQAPAPAQAAPSQTTPSR
jgi:DNA-directed RNA polymerase specialized sigma24 family protein